MIALTLQQELDRKAQERTIRRRITCLIVLVPIVFAGLLASMYL